MMHLCDRQQEMSHDACCRFVELLNHTSSCNGTISTEATSHSFPIRVDEPATNSSPNSSDVSLKLNYFLNATSNLNSSTQFLSRILSKEENGKIPEYLKIPSEIPEDHVTFMFGIFLLISVAVLCTMFIMKMTKPRLPQLHQRLRGCSIFDYDIMLWLPGLSCDSPFGPLSRECQRHYHHRHRRHHPTLSAEYGIRKNAGQKVFNTPVILNTSDRRHRCATNPSLILLLRNAVSSDRNRQTLMSSISHNSLSTVSTNSTNLNSGILPTYNQAMTPSSSFTISSCPSRTFTGQPPSYDETQKLTSDVLF